MIQQADKALAEKNKVIDFSNQVIKQSQDMNEMLTKKVTEKDAELGVWYRNPWITGGIGAGVALVVVTTLAVALKH